MSRVTHMTLSSVVTRVMNVWFQSCQTSVTSLCPFGDSSSKFIDSPWNVGLPIRAKYKHFKTKCEHTFFLMILQLIQAAPFWIRWLSKQGLVQLLCLFDCQFAVSLNGIFEHVLPCRGATQPSLREVFSHPGSFSIAPAEMRDSNISLYCSIWFHSFRIHVESIPNIHGQEMMLVLPDQLASSISSTWDSNSALFPAILKSSTNTDKNNPSVQISFTKEHWIFTVWPRFLASYCRGRRIHTSGHSDFGILSNLWASTIFTWVYAAAASAACLAQSGNLAMTSITFAGVQLWSRRALFSEYCVCSWIAFHNVSSKHNCSFVLLELCLQLWFL